MMSRWGHFSSHKRCLLVGGRQEKELKKMGGDQKLITLGKKVGGEKNFSFITLKIHSEPMAIVSGRPEFAIPHIENQLYLLTCGLPWFLDAGYAKFAAFNGVSRLVFCRKPSFQSSSDPRVTCDPQHWQHSTRPAAKRLGKGLKPWDTTLWKGESAGTCEEIMNCHEPLINGSTLMNCICYAN